jgi:hypothetical protein
MLSILRKIILLYVQLLLETNEDVNDRYIYNHTLVEEVKPLVSNIVIQHAALGRETRNLNSEQFRSIGLVRISSPPTPTIYLVDSIKILLGTTLKHLTGKGNTSSIPSSLLADVPRQVESTIKSARGVEYSKVHSKAIKKPEVTVGAASPGVEFQRKVVLCLKSDSSLIRKHTGIKKTRLLKCSSPRNTSDS